MARLKQLAFLVLAMLLLMTGLLAYLQTRHGFRHLIIPLVAHVTGATINAYDGRLSLFGALDVERLAYEDAALGVAFDVEQMTLSVLPASLFMNQVPRIHDLDLKQANLRLKSRPGSSSEPSLQPSMRSLEAVPVIPVTIERARLQNVTVVLEQGDRQITGQVAGAVNQLGPGQTGTMAIQTNVLLQRDGLPDLSGTLDLDVSVDMDSAGTPLTWQGSNGVVVHKGNDLLDSADPVGVRFAQTFTGEYNQAAQSLWTSSNVVIQNGEGLPLGMADLMVVMDGATYPVVIDASLAITGITGDTINIWLGEAADAHIHAGQFAASVETQLEGMRTSVRGTITGSGIQLRLGDEVPTPPVNVALQHVGSFDQATRTVTIDTLALTISDIAETFLTGTLDRPVSLQLDRREEEAQSVKADSGPAVWSVQLTSWKMRELRPWLALLVNTPLHEVAAAKVDGNLVVSMYNEGMIVDVVGRLEGTDMVLRETGGDGATRMGPVRVVADWRSRLTGLQLLRLEPLTLNVNLKGQEVVKLHANGTWRITDGMRLEALAGRMHVTGLSGATLNPLISRWSPARIRRAQIDGQAEVVVDTDHARWQIDLYGQKMQLRLPETTSNAPPLDLSIKQSGTFDRTTRRLWLDRLRVQVVKRRQPAMTVSLNQPLSINLAPDREENHAQINGSAEPVTLGLQVNHLGTDQLRPWLALAKSRALESIRGGALVADVEVQIRSVNDVAVAGHLDLEEVMFERGEKHASAPVTLDTQVRASVVDRSRLIVESWEVRVLDRGKQLAQASLTGLADSAGRTKLQLNLGTDDFSKFLDRLGLLTIRQQGMISGGNMTGHVWLRTAGPQEALMVKAALESSALHIQLDKTHHLTQSLSLHADGTVDAAMTVADLQHGEIRIMSAGVKSGTLTASGRWRLASTGGEDTPLGAVRVMLQEWDSGPFVDFFDLFPGRTPGPLPLTGRLTLAQEENGKFWSVRGKETAGPIHVAMRDRDPGLATVHLEHDVALNGHEIRVVSLLLRTERLYERPDRVAMNGIIHLGAQPRLQLRGNLEALNVDWYRALMTVAGEPPSANTATIRKLFLVPADGARLAIPLNLDLDLAIGSVVYRNLEIGQGKLVAMGDGKSIRAKLEPTGLAGGSVQGTVSVALKRGQPEIGWDAEGTALDLSVLTAAPLDELKPRVTGRAKFTTSGTGRGEGPAFRQSVKGFMTLDVEDGQFIESSLLDYLAEVTTIDDFRALGFSTVHGGLQITEGWVNLDEVRVDGPSIGLDIDGKVGLDGQLDAQVRPKIGPDLSDHVRIPCLDQLAESVDNFTVLPVAVTVKGTVAHPAYGAKLPASSLLTKQGGALVGTIADFLTGCQGGEVAQEAVEDAVEAITDVAEDLVDDLFGSTTTP